MRKIPSLFLRENPERGRNSLVVPKINTECLWVVWPEGVATRKFDGTCCMVRGGKLYKRYDAKKGKTPPANFEPAQDPDPITGHWTGWVPVTGLPDERWHLEATMPTEDGTYELCGPKINGNPEGLSSHVFYKHGDYPLPDAPRTFDALKEYLKSGAIEGIVWHHPDGRMAKIKTRDFGWAWPLPHAPDSHDGQSG